MPKNLAYEAARKRLEELLEKHHAGTLTPDEQIVLDQWLHELDKNNVHEPLSQYQKADLKNSILARIQNVGTQNFASHSEPKKKSFTLQYVAAAAALVIAATAGIWLFNNSSFEIRHSELSSTPATLVGTYEGKQFVTLPDGSAITMNSGSEVRYDFTNNKRTVRLQGEAFFDVSHDKAKPFKVYTGDVITEVLGTAFNINANDRKVVVTVTRGKVQVGDATRVYGQITPDQQIAVDTRTYDFVQKDMKAEDALAWQDDFLILDDVTLASASDRIAKKYKVKFVFANEALKNCKVNARFFDAEALDQVLSVVTGVANAQYTLQADSTILITGIGCE